MSHPERIVPDETERGIVALHLKRYEFAREFCRGADVLDAGCGVGYGSAFLAGTARSVVGVDVSEEAISYARGRYAGENVEFRVADVTDLPFADASFDAVCSFETIEHVRSPGRLTAEARRVLRPEGVFVVSTPRATVATAKPENPYHEREFDAPSFRRLLETEFAEVELYGQHRVQTTRHRALQRVDVLGIRKHLSFARGLSRALTGTAAMADVDFDGIAIDTSLDDATELVAVCRA